MRKFIDKKLVIASNNDGKVLELKEILKVFDIQILSNKNFNIPNLFLPKDTKNKGNYIISLGNLCKWLGKSAEHLGFDIFPGFTAKDILFENNPTFCIAVFLHNRCCPILLLTTQKQKTPSYF